MSEFKTTHKIEKELSTQEELMIEKIEKQMKEANENDSFLYRLLKRIQKA